MRSQLPEVHYGEIGGKKPPPLTPEEREQEPDEDAPASKDLIDILGFDPDEIDWDKEEDDQDAVPSPEEE